jgi:hypothetical protein
MPSITRRRLVAGGTAVAAGGYAGYRLVSGEPDADFGSWAPEAGTWPLERYDPANTAHNPHASPPRESPDEQELASVGFDGAEPAYLVPLAGPDRLAVFGDRLATHADGRTTPRGEFDARLAGFGPEGRLHAVRREGADAHLLGYDGDGERYRYPLPGHPEGLTVGRDEVYVGTLNGGVFAYEPGGGRDWVAQGETAALAGSRLYTVGGRDGTLAYREQAPPDRWVTAGPERVWTAPNVRGDGHPPAVADGRLVVGTYGLHESVLVAVDADTGERLWEPKSFADGGAADVSTPAVVGRDGYVAAGVDGLGAGFVARYDLETGEEVWRDDTDWYAYDPVLADGTLVVAGDVRTGPEAPATRVRAYDTGSGDDLWTVTFPGDGGTSVALVEERVLATAGSSLYELA